MKNTFDNELNRLVDYVKQNSKDGDWVVIKYRDVPKIAEVSSYYVRKMFEMLKDHPNIVFEVKKDADTFKKPLMFKYVSEEEKNATRITEKNFQYLEQEEIDFVLEKMGISEYQTEGYYVLNLINLIASMGAKEKYTEVDISKLSDILVENHLKIAGIVDELTKNHILVDRNGKVRLLLNSEAVSKEIDNPFLDNSEPPANLLENMQGFLKAMESMQAEFQGFLQSQINVIKDDIKKDEELDKGHQVLQDLIAENQKLQQDNDALQKELTSTRKFRDHFIEQAEGRMEILLAEIIGIVSAYANLPAWQKDEKVNAKLQKNILSAVTAAVEGLLKD